MNENIDLTKILKDCPKGTKLYSTIFGEVEFEHIETDFRNQYVIIELKDLLLERITFDGKLYNCYDGECTLFPSKEQRDWSKFTAPWRKKERFDHKILKVLDKVLVKDIHSQLWKIGIFSHYIESDTFPYKCVGDDYKLCIPYNDDTKHLVGTTKEAPEFYRYWEE